MSGGPSGITVDARAAARWRAEARQRGMTLAELIEQAVESWLASDWDGTERRRDQQTVLEATGTGAAEHRPGP